MRQIQKKEQSTQSRHLGFTKGNIFILLLFFLFITIALFVSKNFLAQQLVGGNLQSNLTTAKSSILTSENNQTSSKSTPKVLAATDTKLTGSFTVNVPSIFNNDIKLSDKNLDAGSGKIFGSNLLYSVAAGPGLNVSEGQTPTITNTDPGSAQKIFKTITVNGQAISANSNNATLNLVSPGNELKVQNGQIVFQTANGNIFSTQPATSTQSGYLSFTDFNTFNAKVSSITGQNGIINMGTATDPILEVKTSDNSISTNTSGISVKLDNNGGLITSANGVGIRNDCNNGDVIKWNGSGWLCGVDAGGSAYIGGTGINITGSTISNTGVITIGTGTGISNTGTSTNPVLVNTGVTTLNTLAGGLTLAGTTNQVAVANGVNTITLSLPQSIATTSTPTFAGLTIGTLSGVLKATSGVISGSATTSDIPEGSNLYYTLTRFNTDFAGKSTTDLAEGINLYFTAARFNSSFDTRLATKTTDNLAEGVTNLYFTNARFDTRFNTDFASKTTTDLAEGSNLYYTQARFDTAFAGKTTDNLTQGTTNKYYSSSLFNADLATKTTDNLAEGSTNLYFTVTRARTSLSATTPLSYNNTTGAFSIQQATALQNGFLTYTDWNIFNNKQDALGFTPENSANKGIANGYASLDGTGKVPLSQLPSNIYNQTFIVNSQAAMLALAAHQGDLAIRTDINQTFVLQGTDPTNINDWVALEPNGFPVTSVNGKLGDVVLTTSDIAEGTNLYYTTARFSTDFASKTTDNLTQGVTNKYYSTSLFNTDFGTKTTDNLSEGTTNLYFTNARARSALSATGPLTYNSSTGAFGIQQATALQDGYLSYTDWNNFNNKVSSQWITTGSNIYYNTGNVGVGNTNPTSAGLQVSTNGAASKSGILLDGSMYSGGTGTTDFPQLFIQPSAATAATTWSTSGTAIGVNTASGFTGNFLDFHVNGAASVAKLDYTGGLYLGSKTLVSTSGTNAVFQNTDTSGITLALGSYAQITANDGGTASLLLDRLDSFATLGLGTSNATALTIGNTSATATINSNTIFAKNGAASTSPLSLTGTIFTGGTGTTTFPQFFIQPSGATAVTTWSTNGTVIGINTASGFTGNFLDFHINGGTSVAKLDSSGNLTVNSLTAGSCTGCGVSSQWVTSGSNIYYNTGNVGIGNSSPSSTLDIKSVSTSSSGTGTISCSGFTCTGTGTSFSTQLHIGDVINLGGGNISTVTAIASNISLTINPDLSTGSSSFTYIPAISRTADNAGNIRSFTDNNGTTRLSTTGDVYTLLIDAPGANGQPAFQLDNLGSGNAKAFGIRLSGESYARAFFYGDGSFGIGPGSSTRDIYLSRSAVNTFRIDSDRAGGTANLIVTGNINTNNLIASGYVTASGAYTETTSTAGLYAGIVSSTPRILFANGNNAQNWQIDNNGGDFRWYTPGTTQMTLTTISLSLPNKTINASGNASNTASALALSGSLYSGGTGTNTYPYFKLEPSTATAVTTWSTNGTFFGVNSASGFTGNFLDFHVNGGTSVAKLDSSGNLTVNSLTAGSCTGCGVSSQWVTSGSNIYYNTGNVGIGSTTLTSLFNVGSSAQFQVNSSGNLSTSGTISTSVNGAASTPALSLTGTWFSGGTVVTTKPQLLIEPTGTTSNNWDSNGTGLGINSASAFAGTLVDIQVANVDRFYMGNKGNITSIPVATAGLAGFLQSGAILTGGTGTTNLPQILVQPSAATAATTWSTAGTAFGVNTATGFTGNFLDFHVNGGSSVAKLDSSGNLTVNSCTGCTGSIRLDQITAANTTATIDSLNNAITWNWSTLTTQTALALGTNTTGITNGSIFNVGGGTTAFSQVGGTNTGNLVSLSAINSSTGGASAVDTANILDLFANVTSSAATGTSITTNGLNIRSTINTTGAVAKAINGINIAAPTKTACTTGACTWTGLNIANPGTLANTTFNAATFGGNVGINVTSLSSAFTVKGNAALTGTGTLTKSFSTAVTGTGTSFTTQLHIGDIITSNGRSYTVTSITDNTNMTVDDTNNTLSANSFTYTQPLVNILDNGGTQQAYINGTATNGTSILNLGTISSSRTVGPSGLLTLGAATSGGANRSISVDTTTDALYLYGGYGLHGGTLDTGGSQLILNGIDNSSPGDASVILETHATNAASGGNFSIKYLNYDSAFSTSTVFSINGSTGQITASGTGAASKSAFLENGSIFTGGTGTTTFPHLFIQPSAATAATTWNTAGTVFGVNTASGFTGNFLDFHVNGGSSVAKLDYQGNLTVNSCTGCSVAASVSLSTITAALGTNTIDNLNFAQTWNWSTLSTQTALSLGTNTTGLTTGTILQVGDGTTSIDPGAGNNAEILDIGFKAIGSNTTGNSITNGININSTINTSGATGTKAINAINIAAPTNTACTGGSCSWTGLNIADPGTLTNTSFYAATLGTNSPQATVTIGGGTGTNRSLYVYGSAQTDTLKIEAPNIGVNGASAYTVTNISGGGGAQTNNYYAFSTYGLSGTSSLGATCGGFYAFVINSEGAHGWGPCNATRDTYLYRSAANTLTLDSNEAGGTANLVVTGNINVGSCTGCGSIPRLDQITAATTTGTIDSTTNAIAWNWSTLSTQNAFSINTNGLTTGNALTLASTSTSTTSGSLLKISSATTGAVATNGIVSINATGAYTSTSNVGLLNVNANSTTAGTIAAINGNALTTGVGLLIKGTGTGITSGSLLSVSTATTGAVATNGVVNIVGTGAFTSTSNMGLLSVLANSTTAGTIQNISGNALTTGVGLNIGSTSTGMTSGSLLKISTATTGAVATNGIVSITATGAYTSTSNLGLLSTIANSTTAGTVGYFSSTALTTGTNLFLNMGTALTTGGALNITGASYAQVGGTNTGNLANFSFTNASAGGVSAVDVVNGINLSANVTSSAGTGTSITTNGINIASTINTTGAIAKTINGINIAAPTLTACTTGACTWTGLNVASPGTLANTTLYAATFQGGNVGIGTATPKSPLQVNGVQTLGVGQELYFNAYTGDKYLTSDSAFAIWHDNTNDVLDFQASSGTPGAADSSVSFSNVITLSAGPATLGIGGANSTIGFMDVVANGIASRGASSITGQIFTGGTGTTTFPQFFIQPSGATAATTWSTAGTAIGVNTKTGFTGNFFDFHVNGGASVAKLDSGGNLTVTSCTGCGAGVSLSSPNTWTALQTFSAGAVIGNTTTDSTQVNFQLDSFDETVAVGTCSTTTNQGAMYYSTATNAIRACINGGWEDLVSTAALGLQLFGVVPDSGTNPGDLNGITGIANGPCKVSYTTSTTVTVAPCIAYSGGRKVIVSSTVVTITPSNNKYQHICLTGTNGAPQASTSGTEVASLATVSMPSATAPIVCLADVSTSATAIQSLWDTRTYTTDEKEFVTIAGTTPPALGEVVQGTTTANQATIPAATLALGNLRGVVVATTGAVSTTTINAIIAISGRVHIKSVTTGAAIGTINGTVQTNTVQAGYVTATTAVSTAYANLGLAQNQATADCTTSLTSCDNSITTTLNIK